MHQGPSGHFHHPPFPWHLLVFPLLFQNLSVPTSPVLHIYPETGVLREGRQQRSHSPQPHPLQPALGLDNGSLKLNDCIKPSLLPWFVVHRTKRGTR